MGNTKTTHPVVWFEVLGGDGPRLQQFYGELFGWKIDANNPIRYGMVTTGSPEGIPGGVGQVFPGTRSWVTFYVAAPDLEKKLVEAQRLGAKVLMPRKEMDGTIFAYIEDPQGHVIGLVEQGPATATARPNATVARASIGSALARGPRIV
jgi:predicted enzyme related to lactoylglutathione lyase